MKKRAPSKIKKHSVKARPAGHDRGLKIVVSDKEIHARVRQLARQINRDYAGKTLHVIGILEDCFVFMADLVRALTIPVRCSFVRTQVRDSDSGMVAMREIMYIPPVDAAGKDVLLVQGILQSGITLDHLCRTLMAQQPASLRIAALVDKSEERRIDIPVDYVGFPLAGRFIVGYGMGYQQQYHHLPYLARMA